MKKVYLLYIIDDFTDYVHGVYASISAASQEEEEQKRIYADSGNKISTFIEEHEVQP